MIWSSTNLVAMPYTYQVVTFTEYYRREDHAKPVPLTEISREINAYVAAGWEVFSIDSNADGGFTHSVISFRAEQKA